MAGFDPWIFCKNNGKYVISWMRLDILVNLSADSRVKLLQLICRKGTSIVLQDVTNADYAVYIITNIYYYTSIVWRNFTIPSQGASEVRNVSKKSWRNLSNAIIRIYKISKLWKWYEKNCIKNFKMFIYYLKIDFYGWKNIFLICNNVYSDRSELDLSDTTIRIQNFHFCRKLWWKNW